MRKITTTELARERVIEAANEAAKALQQFGAACEHVAQTVKDVSAAWDPIWWAKYGDEYRTAGQPYGATTEGLKKWFRYTYPDRCLLDD